MENTASQRKRPHEFSIEVKNKRCKQSSDNNKKVVVVDVTSKSNSQHVCFSPFHPYQDVESGLPYFKVPGSSRRGGKGERSFTVEGIWQGLKVFENEGIDRKKFTITNSHGIKRSSTRSKHRRGPVRGHQFFKGENEEEQLLDYVAARKQIYIPAYNQLLEHPVAKKALDELFQLHLESDLILLDYTTNEDINNTRVPLSHASLVKARLHQMFEELNSV